MDGYRYHFLRDQQFGPDGEFSYEAMVARYNADLANNLGNLLARVSAVVAQKCGRIGPAPRPDSPLAEVAEEVYEARPRPGRGSRRARHSKPPPGGWSRAANAALEAAEPWRTPSPRPAVDAVLGDALEVLRIVAVLASPALTRAPEEIWRRIGLTGSPRGAATSGGGQVGRVPGRPRRSSGGAPFPAAQSLGVVRQPLPHPLQGLGIDAIDEARAAGVTRLVTVGTDAEQSAAALEVAASMMGFGPPSAFTPTMPPRA